MADKCNCQEKIALYSVKKLVNENNETIQQVATITIALEHVVAV